MHDATGDIDIITPAVIADVLVNPVVSKSISITGEKSAAKNNGFINWCFSVFVKTSLIHTSILINLVALNKDKTIKLNKNRSAKISIASTWFLFKPVVK